MQARPVGYRAALAALDRAALAAAVVRDVGEADGPEADLTAARAAVDRLLDALAEGPVPGTAVLERIGADAAAGARNGQPLQPILDRALSAGWIVWGAVTDEAGAALPAADLAALGEALLRTGDAAAAAIANAHEAAERELARRSGAASREVLDALLELDEADAPSRAWLERRLRDLGIPSDRPASLLLVGVVDGLEDADPRVVEVARRLARSPITAVGDLRALSGPGRTPVVATMGGRLLAILPDRRSPGDPLDALDALGPGWLAVRVELPGLLALGGGARAAAATLAVASRLGRTRAIVRPDDLALERVLLADPALLRAAVAHELGPLVAAPRSGDLVATLEAYLGSRENVRATARTLGVAPRTVAYRLERIERLLGDLDAERRLRLAAALLARRLLDDTPYSKGREEQEGTT